MIKETIIIICYIFAEIFKLVFQKNKKIYRLIPLIVGLLGGLVAVIFYLIDKSLVEDNVFNACKVGIISGLASTGSNQLIKQLFKEEKNE